MILKRDQVTAALKGQLKEIRYTSRSERCLYRVGGSYPVRQWQEGRPEPPRVVVTEIGRTGDEWTVRFELDRRDVPRLLHRVSERGYTDDPGLAMRGEPEAVDESELKYLGEQARKRYAEFRQEVQKDRQDLALGDRLERALRDARGRRRDVSSHVRVIKKRLEEIEKDDRDVA